MTQLPKNLLEGWKIVLIDDNEDSLAVANFILLAFGADVYTAINGKQGLRLVKHVKPAFVISDLSMPVMDGWTFIKAMKADPMFAGIPVIALTAHAMVGDRERAIKAGFYNYLTKPLTVDTFMTDLVKLLSNIPEFAEKLHV